MVDHVELDSHLSRAGPPSKSLKRSASVASLPTPPRTVRKRSRSRGSAYHSSDDEADDALPIVSPHLSPSQNHHVPEELSIPTHKRRRIDAVVAELNAEEREDSFWLSDAPVPPQASQPETKTARIFPPQSKGKPPSSSRRGPPTSARRLSQSRAVPASAVPPTWSLLSPPPTRPRPPVTPPRKRSAKPMPVRDSPNNPFLVGSSVSPGSLPSSPIGPRTPVPDKETIYYVFRGKRLAFQNPHFGVPRNPRSKLQPDNPDFSPSEDCTPRRLFDPLRKGKSKVNAQTPASATQKRSPSPAWEDDGDDNEAIVVPPRASLTQEFEKVGKAEGKRSVSPVKKGKEKAKGTEERKESTKSMALGQKDSGH